MPVYDKEPNEDSTRPLSASELAAKESELGDYYNNDPSISGTARVNKAIKGDDEQAVREQSQTAEREDDDTFKGNLRKMVRGDDDDDDEGAELFNKDGDKRRFSGKFKLRGNNSLRNKILLGAAGAGVAAIVASLLLFGSAAFKLDGFLNNVDAKTFSRFNASISGRSDKWLKSYIQIRMMQREGTFGPDDNLFFRSNKVDTNNPVKDWYRTLNTRAFEKKMFNDQGVSFLSVIGPDGKFRTGKITFPGGDPATIDPAKFGLTPSEHDAILKGKVGSADFNNAITKINVKDSSFLDVELFNNNKDARKAVKASVKENTRFFQVIKRRALRRDIQNMTGIGSWRFFEKTNAKITNFKTDMQKKVLQKVFSGDSANQKFLLCLFAAGPCPSTTDPNDPDNHASNSIQHGDPADTKDNQYQTTDPATGKPVQNTVDTTDIANSTDSAVKDVAGSEDSNAVEQDLIKKIISKFIGEDVASPSPSKIYSILKKLASIDKLFTTSGGGDSKLVKLVKNARRTQAAALYATYEIAHDQLHTGDATNEQIGALTGTLDNFNNSEVWAKLTATSQADAASADSATNTSLTKEEYCSPSHIRTSAEYGYQCPDMMPNGGGNAQALTDDYNKTIGLIIHPIALAVENVQSIFGGLVDIVNKVVDKVSGPLINAILNGTGLGNTIAGVVGTAMEKLVAYVGAAPQFNSNNGPGNATIAMIGAAVTAESETRASGGIASTPATMAYTTKLTNKYLQDQADTESLYTRYASLSNPNSLFSTTMLHLSTVSWHNMPAAFFGSIIHLPATINNAITPWSHADVAANDAALTQSLGVDTYDIPQVCQDLDPLDPDYLSKATNAWTVLGIPQSWDTLNNSDTFWSQVYDSDAMKNAGSDDAKQKLADSIYNCGTLDQRVRGGLGDTSGYKDDGGYQSSGSPATLGGASN